MWPLKDKVAETKVAETPDIQCPPFGAQVAGLTQFGKTWINLNEVSVIEFDPPDGCGAECRFKEAKGVWHITDSDALAMRTYLEAFEQLKGQVDEA